MNGLIAFILGGITMPAIYSFVKKILNYKTWKVINYKRVYDPVHEFAKGHYNEINEHSFKVENLSSFNWVLEDIEWNGDQSKPYLFISCRQGNITITNEESYESIDPSINFDGSDYPVGETIIFPNDTIEITLQNTNDLNNRPLVLKFRRYIDTNSILNWILSHMTKYKVFKSFNTSKIELQIP